VRKDDRQNIIGEKAVGVKWISGYNDNIKNFGLPSLTGLVMKMHMELLYVQLKEYCINTERMVISK
jgi:hypothetical protein